MNDKELHDLIERHLLGELSDSEKETLTQWIDDSAENQERLVAEIEFHHQLLDSLSDRTVEDCMGAPLTNRPRLKHALLFAAALAIALIALLPLVFQQESGVRAEVIAAEGTEAFADGQWLTFDRIHLKAGELRLRLENDIQIDFTGPVEALFHSPMKLELLSGKLTADVGKNGKGFTVITKESEVVDLGTRFGVDASDSGTTDVVVFEGEVKVRSVLKNQNRDWQSLPTGQAIRMTRSESQRLFRVRMAEQLRDWSAVEVGDDDVILGATDNVSEEQYYQYIGLVPGGLTDGVKAFTGSGPPKWRAREGQPFPAFLEGSDFLRTYHKDRFDQEFEITLELGRPCTVYVLIDQRIKPPKWLTKDFEKLAEEVRVGPVEKPKSSRIGLTPNSEGELFAPCSIWRRDVLKPSEIKFGPPTGKGAAPLMYGIAAKALIE